MASVGFEFQQRAAPTPASLIVTPLLVVVYTQEVNAILWPPPRCSHTVSHSVFPCASAPDVTVLQLLHGGVEAPREMQPLYGILNTGTHCRLLRFSPPAAYLHAGHAF